MVIVDSVAVAIMISNHLVMPIVLRRRAFAGVDLGGLRDRRAPRSRSSSSSCSATPITARPARRRWPSIGLLSFAAIAQIAPAFLGGLIWSRGTALGASVGLVVGFVTWAYTLLLPSLVWDGVFWSDVVVTGPFGIAALKPTALFGVDLPQLTHGVVWSLTLNILAYIGFSLWRPVTAMERHPGQRLRRRDRRLGRAELPPVPRQRHRRRVARHGRALSRRGAHRPLLRGLRPQPRANPRARAPKPTSTCCAMPSISWPPPSAPPPRASRCRCCCAAAPSRPKAALKLLDDASAAIQYSRDLLQHALNYAKQGITVLDRDLRLLAWNRAFIDLYELPPNLVRVGVGLDSIVHFNAERGSYGDGHGRGAGRRAHALVPSRSRAGAPEAPSLRQSHRDPLEPAAGRRPRHDLHRRDRDGRGRGGKPPRQRDAGTARPRAHRGTRPASTRR